MTATTQSTKVTALGSVAAASGRSLKNVASPPSAIAATTPATSSGTVRDSDIPEKSTGERLSAALGGRERRRLPILVGSRDPLD